MLVGLGALLLLGGRKEKPAVQETITGSGSGIPGMFPPEAGSGFDIAGYINSVFGELATVPKQPPMSLVQPKTVVVTSSGVPARIKTAANIITPTTKVQIGGDGGETVTASALAVKRTEQIKKQEFLAAANVQPRTWAATVEANRIEEARQKAFADKLIADRVAAQLERNKAVVARTREAQERLAKPLMEDRPPTINFNVDDDEWSFNPFATAGQEIVTDDLDEVIDVDFTPEYSESFEISGGMDSPGFASEDEQPSVETVHELTAAYTIGF